jgi:hypothetical protein
VQHLSDQAEERARRAMKRGRSGAACSDIITGRCEARAHLVLVCYQSDETACGHWTLKHVPTAAPVSAYGDCNMTADGCVTATGHVDEDVAITTAASNSEEAGELWSLG